MTHSPADIVRWLLVQLGVGTDPTATPLGQWPVYESNEPSSPDMAITCYDTVGSTDGRAMVNGELYYHYGFQVRVRSLDAPSGWLRTDAIRTALAQQVYMTAVPVPPGPTPVAQYVVHCIARIGEVLPIGKETPTSKRTLHTLNALIAVRQL